MSPADVDLGHGADVVLDGDVARLGAGRVLLGGDPGRLVRLSVAGATALDGLADVAVQGLVRVLVDGGLAHPRPGPVPVAGVTVVIPVRDRSGELDRCLAALGQVAPVVVVDDGSLDPVAVAAVAARHGARVVLLPHNLGPAGARNAGLGVVTTPFVALLDSDCVPPPDWLARLLGHFADPTVGAAAPRVRSSSRGATLLARYARARGPLDLGRHEAGVRPGGRVPYVPTAALLLRRSALAPQPFDERLRYGEDVDVVWRLHDAGWRVRYDPRTVVGHEEPATWQAWLGRRYRYGTSAAPLARRHPGRLTPLVLAPWPTVAWLLLAARRPVPALLAAAVPAVRLQRLLARTGLPPRETAALSARTTLRGVRSTAAGLGGAGTVATAPVLLALLAVRRTRLTALTLLLVPPLLEHRSRRPQIDPLRWTALRLVDDLAYAAGVWQGCRTARTTAPLRPRRTRPR